MVDLLIATLSQFNLPIFRQGSQSGNYPNAFYTFWNNDTNGDAYYDDSAKACDWDYSIYFYSDDPASVEQGILDALQALRASGFVGSGKGYDVPSDEPTHTGRAIRVQYQERED
jgi:hypothetical protein